MRDEASYHVDWGLLRAVLGSALHPGGAQLTDKLLTLADPPKNGVLIDIGAGEGEALGRAKNRLPSLRVIGVDPASPASSGPTGLELLPGTATRIPWPSGAADVVLSECSLCLAGSWGRALAEVRRVLRSGGRLVFSDFYAEGPVPQVPPVLGTLSCLGNVRSGTQMSTLLERAGFSSVRLQDESDALRELEARVQSRMDVRGLLAKLSQDGSEGVWAELHEFLEGAIRARDAGALRYGIFCGTR